MDQLVAHRVQDQHFVLAFFDFALVVVLPLALDANRGHGRSVKKRVESLTSMVASTRPTPYTGARLVVEGGNTSMAVGWPMPPFF